MRRPVGCSRSDFLASFENCVVSPLPDPRAHLRVVGRGRGWGGRRANERRSLKKAPHPGEHRDRDASRPSPPLRGGRERSARLILTQSLPRPLAGRVARRALAKRAGWGSRDAGMTCGQPPSFSRRGSRPSCSSFPSLRKARGRRAQRRNRNGRTLLPRCGASRRAVTASLTASGPRFRRSLARLASSASSWRGVLVPPGGAPAPPERVPLLRAHPRAPVRSTRAGATGSRPSWERTGRIIVAFCRVGISSHKDVIVILSQGHACLGGCGYGVMAYAAATSRRIAAPRSFSTWARS